MVEKPNVKNSQVKRLDLQKTSMWNSSSESRSVEVALDTDRQGKLNLRIVKLLHVGTSALVGRNLLNANNLNGISSGTMTSTHVTIARSDGIVGGNVTVFSIHVVRASARIVSKPDSVILHLLGSIRLLNFLNLDNLAVGLLNLLQFRKKVPEPRLCNDMIGRKDGHAVQWWVGDLLGGQMSSHDTILTQL